MRKSVLDVVVKDIERLKLAVGSTDKRRLDQHFGNVRAIEKRLQMPDAMPGGPGGAGGGCAPGAAPGLFPATTQGEQFEAVTTAMSELAALALACDQTRVFSMLFTGSIGGTVFWPAGVRRGHHQLTHDEPGDQPQIQATTVYTMQMLAVLLQKLKDTPEGAGNLLDSCAILATSDSCGGQGALHPRLPDPGRGAGGRLLQVPRHPPPRGGRQHQHGADEPAPLGRPHPRRGGRLGRPRHHRPGRHRGVAVP